MTDNGPPTGGQTVDQYGYYSASPSNCATYVLGGAFTPVNGNIRPRRAVTPKQNQDLREGG